MNKVNLFIFSVILCALSTNALADLRTDRAVFKNDGTGQIIAVARFQEPVEGDLYIATQVNGTLLFIINEGTAFSSTPAPFRANSFFSEDIVVLNVLDQGISPGRYPLFKVVTQPGADPLDFRNWIGGLNGLRSINFIIGLSSDESLDLDDDGFPDDDLNRDGFHDDDIDRDGFHDGDRDRNGFDDDLDRRLDRINRRNGVDVDNNDNDQNENTNRRRDRAGDNDQNLNELDENIRSIIRNRGR